MFNRIAPRYDVMNRLMTAGRDAAWRRTAAESALAAGKNRILDIATGTGDTALALAKGGSRQVIALDFSSGMIRIAATKCAGRPEIELVVGDAMALPFRSESFDAVTVSFGLRNMPVYANALNEMARVIRSGGLLVCLELTPFQNRLLGPLHALYSAHVVPFIGGLVGHNRAAYRYLPSSIAAFPDASSLAGLMNQSGFSAVDVRLLGLGTVALHVATK
jgi:demethylmenaquinone methyltransferase/2-methoxy-6-polyprenyl-1,4-benzoquinol methylase